MGHRKIWIFYILFSALISFSLTGCGVWDKLTGKSGNKQVKQANQKKEQDNNKLKIGVLLAKDQDDTPQIKKGLSEAAEKEGIELIFLEESESSNEKQQKSTDEGQKKNPSKGDGQQQGGKQNQNQQQDTSQQKAGQKNEKQTKEKLPDIKALIVQAESSAQEIIKSATEGGIPVVAIGGVPEGKADAVVTNDNFKLGEMQGDFIKSRLTKGNVVLLQDSTPGTEEITAGNKSALQQSPGLKIAQIFRSPSKNSSPVRAMGEYLKNNLDGVQAVIASDSRLALEAIEVLKQHNLNGKVLVVGAGTHKEALAGIASGDLHADVDKSPYLQGLYAYKLASQLAKQQAIEPDRTVGGENGEIPAKIVPIEIVKPENLAQFQKKYAQVKTEAGQGGKGGQNQQKNGPKDQKQTQSKAEQNQSVEQTGGGGVSGNNTDSAQSGDQKQGSSQDSKQNKPQDSSNSQGSSSGSAQQSGATQIREKIRTETTREMLGQDGKVIGTETEVKEEVRTLPVALSEKENSKDAGEAKTNQSQEQQKKQ